MEGAGRNPAEKLPSQITLFSCIKWLARDAVKRSISKGTFSTLSVAQEGQTTQPADRGCSGDSSLMRLETDLRHRVWMGWAPSSTGLCMLWPPFLTGGDCSSIRGISRQSCHCPSATVRQHCQTAQESQFTFPPMSELLYPEQKSRSGQKTAVNHLSCGNVLPTTGEAKWSQAFCFPLKEREHLK